MKVALWIWRMARMLAGDVRHMFFPDVCAVCGRSLVEGEQTLCLECDAAMPRTGFHLDADNRLYYTLLSQHIPLVHAVSMFHYAASNPYSRIIVDTKYHDMPQLGRAMGRKYAAEIASSGVFDDVDMLVPVPMHWFKQLRRGYNQAYEIALGVADIAGLPVADVRASRRHGSQTRRRAYERLLNARRVYGVADVDAIAGRHIMLVDDVITTGATLVSCCEAVRRQSPSTRISVLTLAATSHRR